MVKCQGPLAASLIISRPGEIREREGLPDCEEICSHGRETTLPQQRLWDGQHHCQNHDQNRQSGGSGDGKGWGDISNGAGMRKEPAT